MQLEAAGCTEPHFRWTSAVTESLGALREENFDCLLIAAADGSVARGGRIDALAFLQGVRAAGGDDPAVLFGREFRDGEWCAYLDAGCEVLATENAWRSPALIKMIQRAIERRELVVENRRLSVADQRRLLRERDEADQLLNQQRQILSDLQSLAGPLGSRPAALPRTIAPGGSARLGAAVPRNVAGEYQELLRTYVIMGSGNLGAEISRIAEQIVAAGYTPREALELHLSRVEALARGLGNRSTRHVLARADLMALELMIHIAEAAHRARNTT